MKQYELTEEEKIDLIWVHLFDSVYLLTDKKYYDEQTRWKEQSAVMYGYATVIGGHISFDIISDKIRAERSAYVEPLIDLINRGRPDICKISKEFYL